MYSSEIEEIEAEIEALEHKKVDYGWTQKDADRYEYLKRKVEK